MIDYFMVSPDASLIPLLHDPDMPLTGGAKMANEVLSNEGYPKRFQQ
jgi:hypothetical protein